MKNIFLTLLCTICVHAALAVTPPTIELYNDYAAGSTGAYCRLYFISKIANGGFETGGVCWSTSANPTVSDASCIYTSRNGNTLLCKLTDLQPSTHYYVRPYIITKSPKDTCYGNEINVYTIPAGNITFTNNYNATDDADSANYKRIQTMGESVKQLYYDWTSISKHFWLNYSPGTPTADANYEGWVRIGSNTSYQRTGTLLHELNHVMGSGTYSTWANMFDATGKWYGPRANEVSWLITGDSSVFIQKSGVHFYLKNATANEYAIGINGAQEDYNSQLQYEFNCIVTQAFTEDGLPPNSQSMPIPGHALKNINGQKYYIKPNDSAKGRYTSYLRENNGVLEIYNATAAQVTANDSAAWYFTYDAQMRRYNIQNVATGNYLSTNKNGNNILISSTDNLQDNAFLFQIIRKLDGTTTEGSENTITTQACALVGNPTSNVAIDMRLSLVLASYQSGLASQQWVILTDTEALQFDAANGITALPQTTADLQINVAVADGQIELSNLPEHATVKCFDVLGKCVYTAENVYQTLHFSQSKGIYILQVTSATGKYKQKIMVH